LLLLNTVNYGNFPFLFFPNFKTHTEKFSGESNAMDIADNLILTEKKFYDNHLLRIDDWLFSTCIRQLLERIEVD
jgi:hypothetical protein